MGSSLGSYLAVLLSSKRHVENLVLRVPADYPNHNFDTIPLVEMTGDLPEIKTWRSGVHGSEDSYALEALARFEGKVLLIESENDEIVPRQTILNYVNTLKDNEYVEHVVMKNQHHLLDEAGKEEFTLLLTGWFKKNF